MGSSRRIPAAGVGVFAAAVVAVGCAAAVAGFGELSTGALVVVLAAGTVVVGVGLVRRTGRGAPPVGRAVLPWLPLLAAVGVWELATLTSDRAPTVSDLLDPVLGIPVIRAVATLAWLAAGAWLVTRPRPGAPQVLAAAMRSAPGRVLVLTGWLWVGVHFLAR